MNQKVFKRRVAVTGLLILSIACFFIYKLFSLHFSEKISIASEKKIKSRRGYIKSSNGDFFAISIEKKSLFANPEQIEDPAATANTLSNVIGYSEKYITERIFKEKRFIWIKRKLEDEEVKKIDEFKIKGLYYKNEYGRVYPYGNLAANIIGFVDVDNNGIEGIEYYFDDLLSGTEKKSLFSIEKDSFNGSSILLTIDKFIQYLSEKEIARGVKEYDARRGVVIVLEVKTGKVLALAKYPNFDPNYYYEYSDEVRGNFSITNSFEPGSTLKIIALAAILEHNPGALKKTYFCKGSIEIGDTTINCGKKHGVVNIADIIKYSCNVGIMLAMKDVDRKDLFSVLRKFGFGQKTGIELPGESRGILRSVDNWSGLSKYSISIGQEISVTSIQMAAAFGAIANEGIYNVPTIIEAIERDGKIIQNFEKKGKGKIISNEHSGLLLRMMRNVVTGGTGEHADFPYYSPLGKTGTAQKVMRNGGYYSDKYVASFIGVAPLKNPDICVFVILDEPKLQSAGGHVAAPVFAAIAKRILPYRGEKIHNAIAKDPYKMKLVLPKYDDSKIPDFKGFLISQAVEVLIEMQKKHGIDYSFVGRGRVYRQEPATGSPISRKQNIILYFK